jgi:hypothetical protein
VVQVYPKTTPRATGPEIGYGKHSLARAVLGTVSVEEDGSCRFEAPVSVPIYFQALDGNGRAVQTMRSATAIGRCCDSPAKVLELGRDGICKRLRKESVRYQIRTIDKVLAWVTDPGRILCAQNCRRI